MALHLHVRKGALVLLSTLGLLGAPLAAATLASACGAGETTSSRRVALTTRVTADGELDAPFTNAYGWSIKLTKAAVSIGPLYYFDGAPIFSSSARAAPRPRGLFERWSFISPAYAHPGHYQTGNAMGQVLAASSVDLALGDAALPDGDGVAGVYRSGRFTFEAAPEGSAAAALDGHVVVLEGKATKGEEERLFRAVADGSDVLDAYGAPTLEGCAFDEETDIEEGGTITVHIKPSVWLDQAELDAVPESADGTPVTLTPEGVAFKAFSRGLKKGSAVVFSYEPGSRSAP